MSCGVGSGEGPRSPGEGPWHDIAVEVLQSRPLAPNCFGRRPIEEFKYEEATGRKGTGRRRANLLTVVELSSVLLPYTVARDLWIEKGPEAFDSR